MVRFHAEEGEVGFKSPWNQRSIQTLSKGRVLSLRPVHRRSDRSGPQIMSQTGESGTVANVYCDPNFRRRGHTTALLERAREQFEPLELSTDQTPDGRAWTDSLGAEPTGPKRI